MGGKGEGDRVDSPSPAPCVHQLAPCRRQRPRALNGERKGLGLRRPKPQGKQNQTKPIGPLF